MLHLSSSALLDFLLPLPLTHLSLSYEFDIPLDGVLPDTIVKLNLGTTYAHPVDNLPSFLLKLTCSYHFNHTVDKLPSTLLSLKFGNIFNQV
jgi:hypothetical protein